MTNKGKSTTEMPVHELRQCGFCNKNQIQVQKLIKGTNEVFICDECIDLCHEILHRESTQSTILDINTLTPAKIKSALDEHVIGQDLAKMILSVAVYNHQKRINNPVIDGVEIDKSNAIMIGPSGSGKTFLLKCISRLLDLPMVMVDATSLTESGYVGLDVEDCVSRLYQAAEQDVAKTQRGIIFIDEIDKKGRKSENASITRDVSGEGVQQALLKLIEGTECKIPANGGRKNPAAEYITIDTKNILFIVGGAFSGISEIISKRLNSESTIGFGATLTSDTLELDYFELVKQIESEDLIQFGIIPELIGRLPVIAPFENLTRDQLVQILIEPRNSIIKQYQKLFKLDRVELEFTPEACLEIADQAIRKKSGARGLRSIIETVLLQTQFELPNLAVDNVKKVIITQDVVKGISTPIKISQQKEENLANE